MTNAPELPIRVSYLEDQIAVIKPRLSKAEDVISALKDDITEIKATLASKEDVFSIKEELQQSISTNINGILRDALNATPANQSLSWARISTITLIITAVLGGVFGILDLIKLSGHG